MRRPTRNRSPFPFLPCILTVVLSLAAPRADAQGWIDVERPRPELPSLSCE
jgi:hypothetical protein